MGKLESGLAEGVGAGLVAGIPQVLVTQVMARLLSLPPEQADIGPRFVSQLGRHLGGRPSKSMNWLFAALFHCVYSAAWGGLYALMQTWRPTQPHVGGPVFASIIYLLAFSPWGGATQSGSERNMDDRSALETLVHWSAALSFSLTLAYLFHVLRGPVRPNAARRGAEFWVGR